MAKASFAALPMALQSEMLAPLQIPAMRAIHQLRRIWWRLATAPAQGVLAVPVTPGGQIVLVRHTYMPGWHLPGGGKKRRELHAEAILRELREEIGLRAFSTLTFGFNETFFLGGRMVSHRVFVVHDVAFTATPSHEIASVVAYLPAEFPDDSAFARTCIGILHNRMPGALLSNSY